MKAAFRLKIHSIGIGRNKALDLFPHSHIHLEYRFFVDTI